MSNVYYNASGAPIAQLRGASSSIRLEFAAISAAFDAIQNQIFTAALPSMVGNAGKVLTTDTFGVASWTTTLENFTLNNPNISGTLSNLDLVSPTIKDFTETPYAPAAGSSFTVSLANGTMQKFTTNANTTITLPTPVAGKSYLIQVVFGGAHTVAITGGGVLKWSNGAAPTVTSVSGKIDTFTFYSVDGVNTMGLSGGNNA